MSPKYAELAAYAAQLGWETQGQQKSIGKSLWESLQPGCLRTWGSLAKPSAKPLRASQVQPKRQVGGSGGGETTPGPLDETSGGVVGLSSKHR